MRGRGVDFDHRLGASRWAENKLLKTLSAGPFWAVRLGMSVVKSSRELSRLSLDRRKEPDLVVFARKSLTSTQRHLLRDTKLETADRRRFRPGRDLGFVYKKACAAIEVEFSPYRAREMKQRAWLRKTSEDLRRRPRKTAPPPIAPNVFVKEEDLDRLLNWRRVSRVPILVMHLFDQECFAVKLSDVSKIAKRLKRVTNAYVRAAIQLTSGIFRTIQPYERQDAQGARELKPVYRVTPAAAIKVGDVRGVRVRARLGLGSSGKYVSHVMFSGGKIKMTADLRNLLKTLALRRARQMR